jgi:ribonuclease Z
VSARELVVLGTASQVPTRRRAHHGAFLRWDDEGILFDPGEGTQRQLTLAGVAASSITRICLTHLHGDHCLGLPGVVQRLALDGVEHPVDLYFPAAGQEYVDRLLHACVSYRLPDLRLHPVSSDGVVDVTLALTLHAGALEHSTPTYGWRLEEPDGRRMRPDLLESNGIRGPAIGELQKRGILQVAGRQVRLEEVSEPRPGQVFAFIMDTRLCDAAVELARDADLLVCESTFLDKEADLAESYTHLTARQAAWIARTARARRLVLTHFSQRYDDEACFAAEARAAFPDVHASRDLDRIPVPTRRSLRRGGVDGG